MPRLNQKGVVHLLLPLLLIGGIIVTVWLVTNGNPLKLFSRASNEPIVFKNVDGGNLPTNSSGVPQSTSATVRVELTSPLGPPASVSEPISGPNNTGTVSYKLAENPNDLNVGVGGTAYTQHPTVIAYFNFRDRSPGQKFLWVEFKDNTGRTDRKSAQIEIIAPSGGTGSGFGKAIKISGAGQYIEIPSNLNLVTRNAFTIEAWFRPDYPNNTTSSGGTILSKKVVEGAEVQDVFGLAASYRKFSPTDPNGDVNAVYTFSYGAKAYGCRGSASYSTTERKEDLGKWKHIAGVINGQTVYLFVNGKLAHSNTDPKLSEGFCTSNFSLLIGSGFITGEIDEVRLSSSARYLSDFTPPSSPFGPEAVTTAIWHLDGNGNDSGGSRANSGSVVGNLQFVDSTIDVTPTPSPTPVISVRVTYPAGGERLVKGQSLTIRWDSQNAPTVMVDLIRPNFEHHFTAPTGDIPNTGSLTTTVPTESRVRTANDYKIRVMYRQNATIITQSDSGTFSIVAASTPTPTLTPTPIACTPCSADVNGDKKVSMLDYSGLLLCFNKRSTDTDRRGNVCTAKDINKDGLVNTNDFNCLKSQFGKKCT